MRRRGGPAKMSDDEAAGYTDQERMAMRDEPEPVPHEFQAEESARARQRRAEERMSDKDKAVEDAKSQCRSVSEQLREVAVGAARVGRDVTPMLARIKRIIDDERSRT